MDRYRAKMKEFVDKLWANPAIQNVPLGKKENQILGFIRENQLNLVTAFQQPQFFPDLSWDETVRLLLSELTDTIISAYRDRLDMILQRAQHAELREYFKSEGGLDFEADRLRDFIIGLMRTKQMRDEFIPVIEAIAGDLFTRYVRQAMERRKLIYIDLVRRDRLDLDPLSIPDLISMATLFRPLAFYRFDSGPMRGSTPMDLMSNARSFKTAMDGLQGILSESVGQIPERLLSMGIDSNRSATDFPDMPGISRLIKILVSRAADWDPNQKQDRGAESPDKSWFSINRRTARYNGFDGKFLEELYQIAGEEGW